MITRASSQLGRCSIFFFNDTATTEIYTLSLHDALPISLFVHSSMAPFSVPPSSWRAKSMIMVVPPAAADSVPVAQRSEEHTSELQSRQYLVCRLLLEKKNNNISHDPSISTTLTHLSSLH